MGKKRDAQGRAPWVAASAAPRSMNAWARLMLFEAAQKPIEAAALILVTLVGVGLAGMTLAISRYLLVFGEAGLIATTDGYAPSLLRPLAFLFIAFLLLITAIVVAPLYTRLIIGKAKDNPLADAFNWPNQVDRPRLPSLFAYLAAHGPMITLLAYYGLAALKPSLLNPLGLVLMFGLGLAPAGLTVACGPREGRTPQRGFAALFTAAQLGVLAFYWFLSLFILLGDPAAALAPGPSWATGGQLAATLFCVLLAHWFLTVVGTQPRFGLLTGLLVTLMALLWKPGDQLITYNVLRMAGVGGGALKLYRDPSARPEAKPEAACLLLAAGDVQVLELTADPGRCDANVMRGRFLALRDASAADKARALVWLRVVRRERLLDPLASADIAAARTANADSVKAEVKGQTPGAKLAAEAPPGRVEGR